MDIAKYTASPKGKVFPAYMSSPEGQKIQRSKPEIKEKEITYIDIKQQKTGAQVAIPCSSQLLEILKKYDFQMPHLEDYQG